MQDAGLAANFTECQRVAQVQGLSFIGCGRFEGTQLVVISNTLWVGEQVPCLTYGMRGMISLSIEVAELLIVSKTHCLLYPCCCLPLVSAAGLRMAA